MLSKRTIQAKSGNNLVFKFSTNVKHRAFTHPTVEKETGAGWELCLIGRVLLPDAFECVDESWRGEFWWLRGNGG